ncbi:glycoside hydrolase superfamily [Chytriomyces sp. MP71]|nr:glycoside hydrolase superfamily [Chytriomyces sp. MP71]
MKCTLTILSVCLAAVIDVILAQKIPGITRIVSANGSLFVDELGRSRIFRGTNVVYKAPPYVPDISMDAGSLLSFNQKDVTVLAKYGVTAIRLGILWAGVEPVRGQYNQTYLNQMMQIVQMCSDAGIYVLLDSHQDVFSEKYCGEGIPMWANAQTKFNVFSFPVPLSLFPYTLTAAGTPSISDCESKDFAIYQGSYEVSLAFQNLWDNANGMRDDFVNYWKVVAKAFLPFKNILGYDIINEPWNGDIFKNPLRADPIYANVHNLQPFYDAVSEGIRSIDPNAIIFFEPVALSQAAVGFNSGPNGAGNATKNVLNFHYYSNVQLTSLNQTINNRIQNAKALGVGVFMSEFESGIRAGPTAVVSNYQAADNALMSILGWEYKEYIPTGMRIFTGTNDGLVDAHTGMVRQNMTGPYSRTTAHAIAGTPNLMLFDDATGRFHLEFSFNGRADVGGVTEIRTNVDTHYPSGYSMNVSSTSGSFIGLKDNSLSNNSIYVAPDPNNMPQAGASVVLVIVPTVASPLSPSAASAPSSASTLTAQSPSNPAYNQATSKALVLHFVSLITLVTPLICC